MTEGNERRLGFDDESPFFDDIKDPLVRERAKFHAKEHYEHSKAFREVMQKTSADWGRWLIASLLAIHGGAIYTLTNVYTQTPNKDVVVQAIGLNVAGIVATMVCGFFTWLNFQALLRSYDFYSNPARTYRVDTYSATPTSKFNAIGATYFLSVAAGFLSIFFFLASAMAVVQNVNFSPPSYLSP